jgi:tetratricopeptide (TPR) repeat protein
VLIEQRRFDLAAQHLREAIGVDPTHDEALMNFGRVLEAQGDMDRAIDAFRRALEVNPVNVPAHRGLATLLGQRGRAAEALEHWKHAALFGRFEPDATRRYAVAAAQLGRFGDALDALRQGLRRAPDDVPMIAAAVTILATCPLPEYRNGEAATQWAQRLIGRTGGRHVPSLNLLAAAQAERGDFAAATTTSERALALARAEGNTALAARIESRLALYRAERPYHQPLAPAPGPPRP